MVKVDTIQYIRHDIYQKVYDELMDLKKSMNDKSDFEVNCMDASHIIGVGSADVKPKHVVVHVSMRLLENGVKAIKNITGDSKRETVRLVVANNDVLWLGDVRKERVSGVCIAPRVDDDDLERCKE